MRTRLTQTFINSITANPDRALWFTDSVFQNLRLYVGTSGKKVWYVRYFSDGKETTHKLGTVHELTVAQAREAANDFFSRLKRGENPQKKKLPDKDKFLLQDFLANFYEPWAASNRKSGQFTVDTMRAALKDFLDTPVCDLNIKNIEKWRQERIKSGTKAATCNRRLTALNAALNWGVKREYIESNPLAKLEKLPEHDSDTIIRYLAPDERGKLMKAVEIREKRLRDERDNHNKWLAERGHKLMPLLGEYADHIKPMILLALNTGIRRGNLFALKWGDIDFGTKTFRLRAAVTKPGKTLDLPMNAVVVDLLSKWQKQCSRVSPDDLVFPSPVTGDALTNVKKAWTGILQDAGIENFRWHDMRHDFASQLVMKGVDLNTVRELMGHSDIKMTMRYAHLAPSVKSHAVELLTQVNVIE